MEKEYDFSNAIKGKFYNDNTSYNLPIYLEPEVEKIFTNLAKNKILI